MKLVTFFLRASWGIVIFAVITGIVSGSSNAGLIALITTTLNGPSPSPTVLVGSFVGLAFVAFITTFISRVLLIRLSEGVVFDLRMHLSRRILAAPLRRLEEVGPHRLLANLTEDVFSITQALLFIPVICINSLTIVVSMLYLGWLSWPVLAGLIAFIILGVISYQLLAVRAMQAFRQGRDEEDSLFQHFRSLTDGIKELKTHRKRSDAFMSQSLQTTALTCRHYNVLGMTRFTVADVWQQIMFFTFIGLLIFALPNLVSLDTKILTASTLIVMYTLGPLQALVTGFPILGRANVALRKVEALGVSLTPQVIESDVAIQPPPKPAWSRLELVGVTHTYHREREDSSFTLGPIDLAFSPGELIFMIGGNGSGKTTLAKLLVGLYVPESGEVRVDGEPVTDATRETYRQNFSVLFSDFHLFDSLLGLGAPELDAQAREFLIQLQLDHKVQIKEGVLSTTELSQGQRKRLALLTAYLENRPFYIFDEWASDQDPLFKHVFYTQLLPELKAHGKTILVITHDEKYIHVADRIIKLDYGKLEQDHHVDKQLPEYSTNVYTTQTVYQGG